MKNLTFKVENFVHTHTHTRKMKRQTIDGEKIFVIHVSNKELDLRYIKHSHKSQTDNRKWAKS